MSIYKIVDVLIVGCGTLAMSSVGLLVAWLRTRERAIRAETALNYQRPDGRQRDDRIEATVDAMALELERIGEGQRFVARVLSERSTPEQARMSAPPRSITPH